MNRIKVNIAKYLAAVFGIFCIGAGVAFNAKIMLGNDPVGIFYDGIRNFLGLTANQLGTASYVVNIVLAVFLFFAARKYINIGTVIYILPYGFFVNLGSNLYDLLFTGDALTVRIFASAAGCLVLYFGVAIYVAVNIGVDPMTGMALFIADRFKWDFKRGKWLFDAIITLVGFLLGGKIGLVTLITAFLAGPLIQLMADGLKKLFQKERSDELGLSDVAQ